MDLIIFIIGFLAIIVGLVLLVFNLIKKRPIKKYGIAILLGVVLAITGLFMPTQSDKTVSDNIETEVEESIGDKKEGPYEKEIEKIDANISNTFKGENHIIKMEGEQGNYKALIAFDAENDRFLESIWCGINGLGFLRDMKYYHPELDENINTYELLFFAEDSQTYSTNIDNTDSIEIKKLDLISAKSDDVVTVTAEDVENYHNAEKKAEVEELENELDELQKLYFKLNDLTKEEVEKAIKESGLAFNEREFSSGPSIKVALTDGQAKHKHADSGSYTKISFNKDLEIEYVEYHDSTKFLTLIDYRKGTYWDFRDQPEYEGYYINKPGGSLGSFTIKYDNGNEKDTGYLKVYSKEEQLKYLNKY